MGLPFSFNFMQNGIHFEEGGVKLPRFVHLQYTVPFDNVNNLTSFLSRRCVCVSFENSG